ncbi:MAG: Unknown protein, partial [uncultured Thiotrichaceae bacterium]
MFSFQSDQHEVQQSRPAFKTEESRQRT